MGKEVRVVFCDIRKAFDREWHAGFIQNLRQQVFRENFSNDLRNYLAERKQRVILPGVASDWTYVLAGVPQGSIFGPILFLIYINDIVAEIGSNIRLFADDTSLYIIVENPITSADCLNSDLSKNSIWANNWVVVFNPIKTESMLMSRKLNKPVHPPLFMQEVQIAEVSSHKHIGLVLSNDCTWQQHIDYINKKAWNRINIMQKLKFKLNKSSLEIIFTTFIRPYLNTGILYGTTAHF